jgi:gluconolactonase
LGGSVRTNYNQPVISFARTELHMSLRRIIVTLAISAIAAAPSVAAILPAGAIVSRLATGYNFTEGPVYDGNGGVYFTNLVFSNQANSDIVRYNIATGMAQIVDPNSDGANGLVLDATGFVVSADQVTHRISRRSKTDITMTEEVLASSWNGRGFNSPNDLVIDSAGGVYFTDPDYNGVVAQPEGVYYRNTAGVVTQIITGLNRPNGVILSPGGDILYVAEEAGRRIHAYDVGLNGAISNPRVFKATNVDAAGNPHTGHGPDGLAIDAAGNLYAAVQNEIWAWNPAGQSLLELRVPQDPTNVAFGGADGRTLFITAQNSLYGIELNVPSPALGDFDGDGSITAADYTVWRNAVGSTTDLSADADGSRMIDEADFAIWKSHFGQVLGSGSSQPASATNVPEPGPWVLGIACVSAAACLHRRSCSMKRCAANS